MIFNTLMQTYLHNGLTYVSQLLHNVRVTGLPYGQTIFYKYDTGFALFPFTISPIGPDLQRQPERIDRVQHRVAVGQTVSYK